jgi:hypothetical protein
MDAVSAAMGSAAIGSAAMGSALLVSIEVGAEASTGTSTASGMSTAGS